MESNELVDMLSKMTVNMSRDPLVNPHGFTPAEMLTAIATGKQAAEIRYIIKVYMEASVKVVEHGAEL